jgi:chromosome segregation ATPase
MRLADELKKVQEQESNTRLDLGKLKQDLQAMQNNVTTRQQSVIESQNELSSVADKNATAAEKLDASRATARQQEAATSSNRTQLEMLQLAHGQNATEIAALQTALDATSAHRVQLVKRKQHLVAEIGRFAKEIEKSQAALELALKEAGTKHKAALDVEQHAKEQRRIAEKLETGITSLKRDLGTAKENQISLESRKKSPR